MFGVSPIASQRPWRSIVAGVLAYALVLQGFLFAAAIGPVGDASSTGFALCTHDGPAAAQPDAPQPVPASDQHCPFCLAGAFYVGSTPPAAASYDTVAFTKAAWLKPRQHLVAFFINESARPRGPPAAA
jgi:hypothetical protein